MAKVKQVLFEEASATSDWHLPYRLINKGGWIPDVDEIVLGMSPDNVAWDDYGHHVKAYPPGNDFWSAPWFQASSRDGSGIVTLMDPDMIDIRVPWHRMRGMGVGGVNVGLQYRNLDTDSRTTLLIGRLPLLAGVV
jgi:hypothetical protein